MKACEQSCMWTKPLVCQYFSNVLCQRLDRILRVPKVMAKHSRHLWWNNIGGIKEVLKSVMELKFWYQTYNICVVKLLWKCANLILCTYHLYSQIELRENHVFWFASENQSTALTGQCLCQSWSKIPPLGAGLCTVLISYALSQPQCHLLCFSEHF